MNKSRRTAPDVEAAGHAGHHDRALQRKPGATSLTSALPPMPKRAGGDASGGGDAVQAAAAHGTSGRGGKLPHLDAIQRSFGHHDVGGVQAHTDGNAAAGAQALGAEAFATGDHVAFAGGAPSLHTAAHEAAHTVQQRGGGVQLKGGLGQAGDDHERNADAVADRVVAGQSSEALLDAYAPGGKSGSGAPGSVAQRRLSIGGTDIAANEVAARLQAAVQSGAIDAGQIADAQPRLEGEANAPDEHPYPDWIAAAHGLAQRDAAELGSTSITRGTITFTNVSKTPKYRERATQILDLIVVNPSISRFINNRPCFITLVNTPDNPASVIDLKTQVNINLAYWYFQTYELGYMLGMLSHEFAIHPMASQNEGVQAEEEMLRGQEIPTGVNQRGFMGRDTGQPHNVNSNRSNQVDHIFGSLFGTQRNNMYRTTVTELANQLAEESARDGSTIKPEEVTNLIDCFVMDCASTLATDDDRSKGPQNAHLMVALYNDYLASLRAAIKSEDVRALFPKNKTYLQVAGQYATVLGRLATGQASGAAVERTAYQPTDAQNRVLEQNRRRLHWIEPDGRCVFGAIGHLTQQPASAVIATLLSQLDAGFTMLVRTIENAGMTVDAVTTAIRAGNWNSDAGDILLELAVISQMLAGRLNGVTVLRPDGSTHDIMGGGPLVIRVTSPLEHYHATN